MLQLPVTQRSLVLPALLVPMAVLLAATLPGSAGAAYRCEAPGESPRFSQFPCGSGVRLDLEPAQAVTIPPLSDAERARLETLEANRRREQAAAARERRRAAAAAADRRREAARRCDAARVDLEALERQRRKGYTLSESRRLDRREADLADEIARYC